MGLGVVAAVGGEGRHFLMSCWILSRQGRKGDFSAVLSKVVAVGVEVQERGEFVYTWVT